MISCTAIRCFFDLMKSRLEVDSENAASIVIKYMPVAEMLVKTKAKYCSDPEVYGCFNDKLEELQMLVKNGHERSF